MPLKQVIYITGGKLIVVTAVDDDNMAEVEIGKIVFC